MSFTTPGRWFTAIPLRYEECDAFWQRDAGLTCLGLRDAGSDSKFVALGETVNHPQRPLITAPLEHWSDPEWWRQWGLDGVFLYSWAAPRYEPVARAIKMSGARLGVRLDSDGTTTSLARQRPWNYFTTAWRGGQDYGKSLPLLRAAAKTVVHRWFPHGYDDGVMRHLNHADFIVIESPLARQRFITHLLERGRQDLAARVTVIPHPVQPVFDADPPSGKKPLIIAVGRWNSKQKDAPRLLEVLSLALRRASGWSARLIGPGDDSLRLQVAKLPGPVRDRIEVVGPVRNSDLVAHYQEARIQLAASRFESFHIAAAESLCCGCSVVGPAVLASFHWFASQASGAVSPSRLPVELAETLLAEIAAWESADRDPLAISRHWRQQLVAQRVAEAILRAGNRSL